MFSRSSKAVTVEPAPPGQTINLVDPPTQTAANIALYTVMLTACALCLAVRMYTRVAISRQFGFDDGKQFIPYERYHFLVSFAYFTFVSAFCIGGFVSLWFSF